MINDGLTPKNAGRHSTRSASLPTSTEPTCAGDAMRQRRIDRVLRDVALGAEVVVARAVVLGQRAALHLHLVRRLPRARDDLADAAHGLRVRRDHRERAQVVQDVLGRDGLAANARLGERDVLGNAGVQVMADHQHVEMLVDGVDGVRPRRVRRGGQHVVGAARFDDVRRVAAAGAFRVIRVDRAAAERRERRLDEARLVQRVGVDRDLHVVALRDVEARRRSPPASCPSLRAA